MSRTVLIAEANTIFLEALVGILSLWGFTVVGTTTKRAEVVALVRKTHPDLLLLDCDLASNGVVGLSDLEDLKDQLPELKILLLGFQDATARFLEQITRAGFHGFWNKFGEQAGFLKTLNLLFP